MNTNESGYAVTMVTNGVIHIPNWVLVVALLVVLLVIRAVKRKRKPN